MELLTILLTLCLCSISYYFWALFTTYQKAKAIGLPIILTPIHPQTSIWVAFSVPLRPLFQRYLPASLALRLEMSTYGNEHTLQFKQCEMFGTSYLLVGPGYMELWTADPDMFSSIMNRPRSFQQSGLSIRILAIFGPNATSSNGEDWQRQRKVIAPIVNERISRSVWDESREQAKDLTGYFLKRGTQRLNGSGTGSNQSTRALRQVAVNVLGAAGYGQHQKWSLDSLEKAPEGHEMSYIGSLVHVIKFLPFAALFPRWLLDLPFMPEGVRKTPVAMDEFQSHAKELVASERLSGSESRDRTLLSIIVKMSDQGKTDASEEKAKVYLSEHEIQGNMFLFTAAGLDTTANTMAYAMALIALDEKLQNWLIEEIDEVMPQGQDVSYEAAFPRLKRMLAVMFETLRLYTPVAHSCRTVKGAQTVRSSDGSSYVLPDELDIFVSYGLAHRNPKTWGDDVKQFRPARWFDKDGAFVHREGRIFAPWSLGPRACPGMKMAQVEFVSTIANVLRQAKVRPVVLPGETMADAETRTRDVIEDSQPLITLEMKRPGDLLLEWRSRWPQ